ncbi:MAG: ATP-binding protein [Nitrospirota bacterium]|nr:ATP-binding protein [Nitrospirota bacterium]
MNHDTVTIITLFSICTILFFSCIMKIVIGYYRKRPEVQKYDAGHVGFVVDTFHTLVSRLKEKERELEMLKKNAEEKATTIEIYNENIFQSVPSGVISFDRESRITRINSTAAKILGLKESNIAGRRHNEILNSPITDIIESNKTVERAEISYTTQTSKRIWLGLTISPLKDSSNNIIGQILVFTDLTELKAFQSQMELRERLSSLGEMSAGIAHELRNPMAVISGYTKILSKKVDNSLMPAIDSISREVAVMDRIITDFLSFARPSELIPYDVDLDEIAVSCIKAIEVLNRNGNISIRADKLPVIKGDEIQMRQLFSNLFQNAVEAMPDGGSLNISVSTGDSLVISISDTGHGIPDNIRDKIFLPFYTTKERGTGLGLSIAHKIAISHGGSIQVDTGIRDKGTTFILKFPAEIIVDCGPHI